MQTDMNEFHTLRPDAYVPRIVDAQVEEYLKLFGAVEIAGTKWCGKTWTSCAHGRSITYLDSGNNLELALDDPTLVLEGERPHIIDEWQKAPSIWNTVRHEVDKERKLRGAWILTGSSTPNDDDSLHSGAGRIGRVRMLPMTLFESGDSSGTVSLSELFEDRFKKSTSRLKTRDLVEVCCRGGWPEVYDETATVAQRIAREYLAAVYERSAPSNNKNSLVTQALVRSIARNLGQSPTYKTLATDMYGDSTEAPSDKTIASYLAFLKRIYLLQDIPGWLPPARSPKRLHMKPKRYLADPSLAVAALGLSAEGLRDDWQTFGLIFENLCIRDLSVYARALSNVSSEPVRYYRDEAGMEADAIIERDDGSWAAFEFKVSEEKVEQAIASLKRVRDKVASAHRTQAKVPSFMAVITGNGEFARQAEEGIFVIPIGTLGP